MNTTNFNQPTPGSNKNENNSKRLLTMAAIAIGILLLSNIVLLVSKYKTGKELETTVRTLETKTDALNELEARFSDATSQLEQLKGTNTELNAKIDEQMAQLTEQKTKIESMIKSTGDLKRARAEIQDLVKQKDSYVMEIGQLKEQVAKLTEANTQLDQNNKALSTDLADTKTKLESESTAKATLISEKQQLETTNTALGKKVDIGSAVRVNNITVKGVKVSESGKEKTKSRAKKVDKLNICFDTEVNEVVESGEETFHIIVVDPTGAPLLLESLGSGVSFDKKKESEFRYTTVASCSYTNSVTNVCGAWQPGQNFIKGKYTVEVFNKGFPVGKGEFKLK